VEVLGRYSNLRDQGERVQAILEMVPTDRNLGLVRTSRQAQHRLSVTELDDLVAQYGAGAEVRDLATRFDVNRDTVFSILKRRQVVRHARGVPPQRVEEVVKAYEAGSSLATIGAQLSVDPGTVARTLRSAGVELRPRKGWV
jgi:DNA-directed RNA polymerase specialized sigma24 family protein